MKYGSVCSGIEAASVAWESLGWQAQWYSEIEHFPSAVLAHRFPAVPNLGDMTQIHNSEHFNGNSIDLLVGGTPCQSFSVAGLRKGLDDTRGQLMLTFCELAARKRPRWVVWENVPGVLSSNKGEDLASFLGLLTGREIHPPVGGWKNSGVVEGIGSAYGVAWTVLDAQYFGVAQRRRRIFAVGYLGDWRPAAAVLFESYRLSGDIKEGRKKRKATSSDAEGGFGGRGFRMTAFGEYADDDSASTLKQRDYKDATDLAVHTYSVPAIGNIKEDNVSSCMTKHTGMGSGETQNPAYVAHAFKVRGGSEVETGEQGGTPGKKAGKGYLGSDELAFTIGTTQDQQIAQYPIAFQSVDYGGDATTNLSPTLRRHDPMAVAQPVPFRKVRRAKFKGDFETWEQDEKTNTLNTFDLGDIRTTQAVVQPSVAGFLPTQGSRANGIGWAEEQSPTLRAGCDSYGVIQPIAVDTYNQTVNENSVQTIRSDGNHTDRTGAVLTPQAVDFRNQNLSDDVTGTLQSKSNGGYSLNYQPGIIQPTMAIRRLLPTECEILQGFPRNWTLIPYRGKPAEQCPDGPRYKACGNSMAVPVMRWIGQRIQMVEDIINNKAI